MFRLLPITLLLIVSLASIGHAGFDVFGIPHAAITAVYYFESTEGDGTVTKDGSLFQNHGFLWDGATITENGKYDNCLQLTGNAGFGTTVSIVPVLADSEFSIAAWVKLPKQTNENSLYLAFAGRDENNDTISGMILVIMPSGNIRGLHRNSIEDAAEGIETDTQNVADDKWHHIVFSRYITTYALYIDGETVATRFGTSSPKFAGDSAALYISNLSEDPLTGTVLIDELGFFQTGFSPYEARGLYNDGLAKFFDTMPVKPQGRLATTWGQLKSQ